MDIALTVMTVAKVLSMVVLVSGMAFIIPAYIVSSCERPKPRRKRR